MTKAGAGYVKKVLNQRHVVLNVKKLGTHTYFAKKRIVKGNLHLSVRFRGLAHNKCT